MPAPKLFVADERGLGGRQLLQQQYIHMMHNIKRAAPCLDTTPRGDEVLRQRMLGNSLGRQCILRRTPYHRKVPKQLWGGQDGTRAGMRVDSATPKGFEVLWNLPINSGLRERTVARRRRLAQQQHKQHPADPPTPHPPSLPRHAGGGSTRAQQPQWVSSTAPLPPEEASGHSTSARDTQSVPVDPSYYTGEAGASSLGGGGGGGGGGGPASGVHVSIDYDMRHGVYYYDLASSPKGVRTGATESARMADERRAEIARMHRQVAGRRYARRQMGFGYEDADTQRWRLSPAVRESVLQALACMDAGEGGRAKAAPCDGLAATAPAAGASGNGISSININGASVTQHQQHQQRPNTAPAARTSPRSNGGLAAEGGGGGGGGAVPGPATSSDAGSSSSGSSALHHPAVPQGGGGGGGGVGAEAPHPKPPPPHPAQPVRDLGGAPGAGL